MKRVSVVFVLALLGLSPAPQSSVYAPPVDYVRWADEARGCVETVYRIAEAMRAEGYDGAPEFTLDRTNLQVADYVWIAVTPTNADGTFVRERTPVGPMNVLGFHVADSIYLAAPRVMDSVVVKHEIMHGLVQSPGEWSNPHGLPWGLCEL